jgi:hypothetical protein
VSETTCTLAAVREAIGAQDGALSMADPVVFEALRASIALWAELVDLVDPPTAPVVLNPRAPTL